MPDFPVANPNFVFTTCQVGAERVLKAEVASRQTALRFAYSRPGFLTFKVPPNVALEDLQLDLVFARAWGISLGKADAADSTERAAEVWRLAAELSVERLHVWPRDTRAPGDHDFVPGQIDTAAEAREAIVAAAPEGSDSLLDATKAGQLALDCIVLDDATWWVGYHRAATPVMRVPGGLWQQPPPANAVSNAYNKMAEALAWSGWPLRNGDHCAEIGCAPGGASQALLDRGLTVAGVDPAAMHPDVLAHEHFTHVRMRGADVRRRAFRGIRWLVADMNVAPDYTLDTVEAIVTHSSVEVGGLLLTLKLSDWKLAEKVPEYLERVRGWGYDEVRARQLCSNGQEICICATNARGRHVRKSPRVLTRRKNSSRK